MDDLVKNGLVFELGGGLLIDTAGNNTITNNGATLTADHNGRADRGWSFVTANSAKLVYPNSLVRNKQHLTVAYWVKQESGLAFNTFNNRAVGTLTQITGALHQGNNVNNFYVGAGSSENGFFTLSNVGVWNHYVWIFDGTQADNASRLKCYCNGTQRTLSFSGTIPANTFDLDRELSTGFYNNQYLTGYLSTLLVFHRAITGSEAIKLYNYGRSH